MEISKDTKEVVKFLDFTSENNLRKKNDMEIILELGAIKGDFELVEKILFTGKYLWQLHRTIMNSKQDEGKHILKKEAVTSAEELKSLLNDLISGVDDFNPVDFKNKYFNENLGAFRNLIDLAHDLSRLKEMQTTLKNKQTNLK